MSVKGFSFDGGATVEKYDYTELDNKPSIPTVDGTLSVSGAAADAKAVGDEITDLKADIDNIVDISGSSNLWNPDTTVIGLLNTTTGVVNTESTQYVTTDFIPFANGETIYEYLKTISTGTVTILTPSVGNANNIVFYDANHNYISGITASSLSIPYTITITNVAYIRVSLTRAHFENTDRIYGIFKTEQTAATFEPYYNTHASLNPNIDIPQIPDNISAFVNDEGYITDVSLIPINDRLDEYFETTGNSSNLWNPNTTTVGQLNYTTGIVNTDSTDYIVTDFIPFLNGETIYEYLKTISTGAVSSVTPSVGNANNIAFYDQNKAYISGIGASSFTNPYTITIANVAYIRVGLSRAHFENTDRIYGIFKGAKTADTFEPYYDASVALNPEIELPRVDKENDYALIAYGDSLTAGTGATSQAHRYINQCADALNAKNCIAFGFGGSSSKPIAWTAGALAGFVPPNARTFAIKYDDLTTDVLVRLNAMNNKTVLIDGNEYTISQSDANVYTLPNSYTPSNIYKPIITKNSKYTADIYIIWMGTNGGGMNFDVVDAMIAKIPHNQYIVMGMTRLGTDTTVENELKASEKYGIRFFNTRVQIINNAFALLRLTPTEADEAAMDNGLMPPTLLYDEVHFNDYGYEAIGKLLAAQIKSNGYTYQLA